MELSSGGGGGRENLLLVLAGSDADAKEVLQKMNIPGVKIDGEQVTVHGCQIFGCMATIRRWGNSGGKRARR